MYSKSIWDGSADSRVPSTHTQAIPSQDEDHMAKSMDKISTDQRTGWWCPRLSGLNTDLKPCSNGDEHLRKVRQSWVEIGGKNVHPIRKQRCRWSTFKTAFSSRRRLNFKFHRKYGQLQDDHFRISYDDLDYNLPNV